jgi:molybdate transport system ATP-binding protein
LLLLDEPLAAVDAALKTRILTYLERVIEEWRIPTLFVTHGQAEVRRLAEYVVVLEGGRVLTAGSPDDALGQPGALALRNGAGPANLLRVATRSVEEGHLVGLVGNQRLHLPPGLSAGSEPVYLQFWPNEVTLAEHDVAGLSVRNHLKGQVRQVIALNDRTFVAIDVGQIIWAEITGEAARELKLTIGREVYCLIKTQCLRAVE